MTEQGSQPILTQPSPGNEIRCKHFLILGTCSLCAGYPQRQRSGSAPGNGWISTLKVDNVRNQGGITTDVVWG